MKDTCPQHPNQSEVEQCHSCKSYFCKDCLIEGPPLFFYCYSCKNKDTSNHPNGTYQKSHKIPIVDISSKRSAQLGITGIASIVSILIIIGLEGEGAAVVGIIIAACIVFSQINWRCPSCGKYLGGDLKPKACNKCGVVFNVGSD